MKITVELTPAQAAILLAAGQVAIENGGANAPQCLRTATAAFNDAAMHAFNAQDDWRAVAEYTAECRA